MHVIVETKLAAQAVSADTPPSVLDSLSRHEDKGVRCCVAINPFTGQDTLREMVKDKSKQVLSCLAQNKSISFDLGLPKIQASQTRYLGYWRDQKT